MKVGERGQITIPKPLREKFGIGPETEVDVREEKGALLIVKRPKPLPLEKWKGYCRDNWRKLGYRSVEEFLKDTRGR